MLYMERMTKPGKAIWRERISWEKSFKNKDTAKDEALMYFIHGSLSIHHRQTYVFLHLSKCSSFCHLDRRYFLNCSFQLAISKNPFSPNKNFSRYARKVSHRYMI